MTPIITKTARIFRRRTSRRDIAMLQAMSDSMLKDIGLSRFQVVHAAAFGLPQSRREN